MGRTHSGLGGCNMDIKKFEGWSEEEPITILDQKAKCFGVKMDDDDRYAIRKLMVGRTIVDVDVDYSEFFGGGSINSITLDNGKVIGLYGKSDDVLFYVNDVEEE